MTSTSPKPSPINLEEHTRRTALLRSRTEHFCNAFLTNKPPSLTLSENFIPDSPKITEHGPAWASKALPFLGRTFVGRSSASSSSYKEESSGSEEGNPVNPDEPTTTTCDDYFSLLSKTLKFIPFDDTFPLPDQFIVDVTANAVAVVAHARFESVIAGKRWEEEFIYRLSGFDDQGRIGHWEIWADPLSAWEAVAGNVKADS